MDSHPLLSQSFACPGLLGTPFLQPAPKKHPFCCLGFQPCCCTSCTVLAGEERGGEGRKGEVRQGGQLGSCRLLSRSSALDVAVDARSQPGRGPRRRALAALEGGDGVWIAGDASKHPRVRSDTCLAADQGAVLFALPLGKQSTSLGKRHPPHPAILASRCVAREILHLALPCAERGGKFACELSREAEGMDSPC